jgi:hypothetical protein
MNDLSTSRKDRKPDYPFDILSTFHIQVGNRGVTVLKRHGCRHDIYGGDCHPGVDHLWTHISGGTLHRNRHLHHLRMSGHPCARSFIAKQASSDDALIFIAGILSIAFCITTYKQTEFAMSRHIGSSLAPSMRSSLVVLVVCLDILRGARVHEAIDFATVSADLSSSQFSQGVLCYD